MEFGILHHQYPLHVPTTYSNGFFLRLDDEERIYLGLFYYSYYNNDLLTAVFDADDDDDDGTAPLPSLISEYREVDAGEQNLRYAWMVSEGENKI